SGCDDDNAPRVGEARGHEVDRTIDVAVKGRDDRRVDIGGIRVIACEWAESPPDAIALADDLAEPCDAEKVSGAEVDGSGCSGCRCAPRGVQELTVGLAEALRAGGGSLRVDEGDRGTRGEILGEGL